MSRLEDYQDRHRNLSVPDSVAANLEQAVMNRLRTERFRSRRTPSRVAALGLCSAVAFVIAMVIFRPEPAPPPVSAYVESVMVLDDHISIWLEPLRKPARGDLPQ
ncbi:MAG: hypothetical protein V1784_04605 [bacterium]